jgi:TRAP-type C4-dicarboxylate transport system substrate-binding protein
MKKIVLAALASIVVVMACGFSGHAAEELHWKIGHVRPDGSAIDADIQKLVQRVTSQTDGRITFTVYPANRLGDYTVVQEKCSFGEVEMYVAPFGTTMNRKNALAFTPYLVNTWDEAARVYAHDSVLVQEMKEILAQQNIKVLGGWPVYFGGVVLTREPLSPGDPDVSKEMIIRVPPIRCFSQTAKAMGFTPYPITWMYALDGLKTGMVEGMMGGGAEGYLGLKDLARVYLAVKDHFEHWFVYMNLDVWQSLSEEDKVVIQKAVLDMESQRFAVAEEEEKANMKRLAEQGTTIISLTDHELGRFREKVRQEVWPEMKEEIGEPFEKVVSSLPR